MKVEVLIKEGSRWAKVGRFGCPEQACLFWTSKSLYVSRRCSVGTARTAGAYKRSEKFHQYFCLCVLRGL